MSKLGKKKKILCHLPSNVVCQLKNENPNKERIQTVLLQYAIVWVRGLGHSQLPEIAVCPPSALICYVLTGFQDFCKLFSKHHPAIMSRLLVIIMLACL